MAEGIDLSERLAALSRLDPEAPVVSVYLDTRWSDEHHRDRVRIFVRDHVEKARAARPGLDAELAWITAQVDDLVAQRVLSGAQGVALFACSRPELREVIPVATPFAPAFVVDDRPHVRPLADVVEESPAALVVFVDGKSARLIPFGPQGEGQEVVLESEVPGRHRRGGWALLAESRYRRHIEDHRGRHFEAVVEALRDLAAGPVRIVLAGQPATLAQFRRHLPGSLAARVAGAVAGQRWEPAAALTARARDVLEQIERADEVVAVEDVLTEAAKGGRAVAGIAATLEAVARAAVHRLYLLKTFRAEGAACTGCGALHAGAIATCPVCGQSTRAVDLGEACVERVIATGGTVEMVEQHPGLGAREGIAAVLRYRT